MRRTLLTIALLLVVGTPQAFAQDDSTWSSTSESSSTSTYFPELGTAPTFTSNGQFYPLNLRGMQQYVATLEEGATRTQLQTELDALVRQQRLAVGVAVASTVVSLSALTLSMVGPDCSRSNQFDSDADQQDCWDRADRRLLTWGTLSAVTLIGGTGATMALSPREADLIALVNTHNRLLPDRAIDVRAGLNLDIGRRFAGVQLTVRY